MHRMLRLATYAPASPGDPSRQRPGSLAVAGMSLAQHMSLRRWGFSVNLQSYYRPLDSAAARLTLTRHARTSSQGAVDAFFKSYWRRVCLVQILPLLFLSHNIPIRAASLCRGW